MSSSDAQKSEVHSTADDASTSPNRTQLPGNAGEDREKVSPDADAGPRKPNGQAFPPDVKVKRDESDVGGPIDIETPT